MQPAQQHDGQADGQVRHVVRQHVRRVGDADAAAARQVEVDLVVADAVDRHDLEVRQPGQQRGRDAVMAARHHGLDLGGVLVQPRPGGLVVDGVAGSSSAWTSGRMAAICRTVGIGSCPPRVSLLQYLTYSGRASASRSWPRMLIRTSLCRYAARHRCPAAQPAPARLSYAAYFGGVDVADMQAELALTPQAYRLQLSFQLVGRRGALFHADGTSIVDGRFLGDGRRAAPVVQQRRQCAAGAGDADRLAGRPARRHARARPWSPSASRCRPSSSATRSTRSARSPCCCSVWADDRLRGPTTTFDGRRLSAIDAHTDRGGSAGANQPLQLRGAGPALRHRGPADRRLRRAGRPRRHAQAAPARSGSPAWRRAARSVPVRMTFEAGAFGTATMYLTQNGARE